jgi:hypothetical protein
MVGTTVASFYLQTPSVPVLNLAWQVPELPQSAVEQHHFRQVSVSHVSVPAQ